MKVYTYSEARQRLASLLDQARREGQVQIRPRDGQVFVLQPVSAPESPLDVPAVQARLRPGELEELLQEGPRSADRFRGDAPPQTRALPTRPTRRRRT